MKRVRCAIYTRKSSEDGLEQDFNSLDAQREACASYILSQKHEGWILLDEHYDDGGKSGGSLERPALKKLLEDVDNGKVDQIVVYKIDRLTRSLADFAKLVEHLDAVDASFVSVTQSFNTATSMGRLTLNVLLSFAQFEREVTAERIRDKIGASKKKGLWMGGNIPLGYDADGRSLKINEAEAEAVRALFDLYLANGTAKSVARAANEQGLRTKLRNTPSGETTGGRQFSAGHVYHILGNPIYNGKIRHKKVIHQGQHDAIIGQETWDRVQNKLSEHSVRPKGTANKVTSPSLLMGKIVDEFGKPLSPSHSRKSGKRYRYYISRNLVSGKASSQKIGDAGNRSTKTTNWRLPAKELENKVQQLILNWLRKTLATKLLMNNSSADTIDLVQMRLVRLIKSWNKADPCHAWCNLIEQIIIKPGLITIRIELSRMADTLNVDTQHIEPDELEFAAPFQLRMRGVETRLIIERSDTNPDPTLIANIARAHAWYGLLKNGNSYIQIAEQYGTSKHRVQQLIRLAFLSPKLIKVIESGNQPMALTSDWLMRNPLPEEWKAQEKIIASL